jgi:protein disulfide-isomerase
MRKIIYLFVFLGMFQVVSAQDLTWHTDINKAIELSTKENKPLFLFFTGSDWCGWCIRLQNEVFKKPEFATWAIKNVVLVELDYPRKTKLEESLQAQNNEMQKIFNVTGYPTVWFVKPQNTPNGINLQQIGKMGYLAGGAQTWLMAADRIILNTEF